jgi:hypothetical protein
MRLIFPLAFLLTIAVCTSTHAAITSESLKFQWVANDGSFFRSCTHHLQDAELNDWKVECEGRTFKVHFLVKEIHRPVTPQTSIEVIYFITGTASSSQGVWINLEQGTPLHSLVFHQSVDNDSSDLVLNFRK